MGKPKPYFGARRSMNIWLPLVLTGSLLTGLTQPAPAAGAATPASRPAAQDIARATEYIRRLLKEVPHLQPGSRVVLVADGSFDPTVADLVRQVLWESQARLDVILLQGVGAETNAARLQLDLWCVDPHDMWPAWVWNSIDGAAAVISAYGPDVHNMTPADREWFADRGITRLRFWHATLGTVLVDALEQGIGYPEEILAALHAASKRNLDGANEVHITDPNGTDLRFSTKKSGRIYPDARGKVVVYAMHGGLIPKTTLHLEDGKVVAVEGEGDLAEQMRWIIANMSKLTFPTAPGPGGSFLVEADLDRIHPKIARPAWKGLYGAARYFAFSKGYKRAGVLTIGFGTPTASAGQEVLEYAKANGVTIQHLDTHLYHATVTVDGREVITDGRPLALDDPEVRKIAAKYGDPDELLHIDWIPELTGRSRHEQ